MITIRFNAPTKDTPGFARRQYKAAEFMAKLKAQDGKNIEPAALVELLPSMVGFLADYVEVIPDEGEKAVSPQDALWDIASEEQFIEFLTAVSGGGAGEVPPDGKSAPSATT
jgi:hypothetical protein